MDFFLDAEFSRLAGSVDLSQRDLYFFSGSQRKCIQKQGEKCSTFQTFHQRAHSIGSTLIRNVIDLFLVFVNSSVLFISKLYLMVKFQSQVSILNLYFMMLYSVRK